MNNIIVITSEGLKDYEVVARCEDKNLVTTYEWCLKEYPNVEIKVYKEVVMQ